MSGNLAKHGGRGVGTLWIDIDHRSGVYHAFGHELVTSSRTGSRSLKLCLSLKI